MLGKNIKAAREELGISQRQLGLMVGCGKPYVSEIEAGLRNPTFNTLIKLADGLNTTLEKLLQGL